MPNPRAAFTLDYDALVAVSSFIKISSPGSIDSYICIIQDWEEYLNIGGEKFWLIQHLLAERVWALLTDATTVENDLLLEDDDGLFDPESQNKRPAKASSKVAPRTETVRKETHTLDEHHDHLLSASYELSFSQPGPLGAEGPSSSQVEVPFEDFFPFFDGLDLGDGLGDDLARELGWDISPVKSVRSNRFAEIFLIVCLHIEYFRRNMDVDHPIMFDEGNSAKMDFNFSVEDVPMLEDLAAPFSPAVGQSDAGIQHLMQTPKKRKVCPSFNYR